MTEKSDPVEVMARAIVSFEARDEGAPFPPRVTKHDRDKAHSALAAAESAGMVMVPKVPTEAMLKAGVRAFQKSYNPSDTLQGWRAFYIAAMIEATSLAQQEKP